MVTKASTGHKGEFGNKGSATVAVLYLFCKVLDNLLTITAFDWPKIIPSQMPRTIKSRDRMLQNIRQSKK